MGCGPSKTRRCANVDLGCPGVRLPGKSWPPGAKCTGERSLGCQPILLRHVPLARGRGLAESTASTPARLTQRAVAKRAADVVRAPTGVREGRRSRRAGTIRQPPLHGCLELPLAAVGAQNGSPELHFLNSSCVGAVYYKQIRKSEQRPPLHLARNLSYPACSGTNPSRARPRPDAPLLRVQYRM